MNIVFLVFDGIAALDAVGPCEVLARLPGARISLVGPKRGLVRTTDRALGLSADYSIDEVSTCDLLVVPGGLGTRKLEQDQRVLAWIRAIDRSTRITASVCTGAFLLAAAGLLAGRRATTYWAMHEKLADYGALPIVQRVVRDGKYATSAGVSAGIDLALTLAMELAGREVAAAIQLGIEYDPVPPLDSGNAQRASPELRETVLASMRARLEKFMEEDA